MATGINEKSANEQLREIKAAMGGSVRLQIVSTFRHGDAVQVEHCAEFGGRWRKVGPLLFPPDGGTTLDTISMLLDLRAGKGEVAP